MAIEAISNGVNPREVDAGEIGGHTPPRVVFAGRFMPQKIGCRS